MNRKDTKSARKITEPKGMAIGMRSRAARQPKAPIKPIITGSDKGISDNIAMPEGMPNMADNAHIGGMPAINTHI